MRKETQTPNLRTHETPAEKSHCPRCHTLIITAWVDGGYAQMDTYALDIIGQITAIEQHKTLYEMLLKNNVQKTYLRHYTIFDIQEAGEIKCILTDHHCNQIINNHSDLFWQEKLIDWLTPKRRKRKPPLGQPPF